VTVSIGPGTDGAGANLLRSMSCDLVTASRSDRNPNGRRVLEEWRSISGTWSGRRQSRSMVIPVGTLTYGATSPLWKIS